jgi:hypothetical protein
MLMLKIVGQAINSQQQSFNYFPQIGEINLIC